MQWVGNNQTLQVPTLISSQCKNQMQTLTVSVAYSNLNALHNRAATIS